VKTLSFFSLFLWFAASSPNCPSQVALTKLGGDRIWISPKPRFFGISSKSKSDAPLDTDLEHTYRFIKDMSWKILSHVSSNGIPFQSLLVTPKLILAEKKLPLVVVPHGGPHSGFTTSFLASTACFAMQLGATVLLVNYRGSIGYGQRSIDSLLGGIGRNDVDDMMQAVHLTLSNEEYIDSNRLFVVGGSHGGFLSAHLIGQFPTMFRAAAMRNPVTNIPSMASVSDIPGKMAYI
jgi:dipeptidyl aminopeptidase/acylaminoacyl peptidase